jgi:hypothetical protein
LHDKELGLGQVAELIEGGSRKLVFGQTSALCLSVFSI